MSSHYTPRNANKNDARAIIELYKAVATVEGGIARTADEVSSAYVEGFIARSLTSGIILVVENPQNPAQLIAEIHAYKAEPKAFNHLLTDLTIGVHPQFQGQGIGYTIFKTFLDQVASSRPDIVRVELMVRENNTRARALYKKLGFVVEGIFADRIQSDEEYEADVGMAWFNPNAAKEYSDIT